jgi:hypothetical protein
MLLPGNNIGNYQISAYGPEKIAFQYPPKKYLNLFMISVGLAIVFGLAISDLLFGHEEMLDYLLICSLVPFVIIIVILCIIYASTPTGFGLNTTSRQILFSYLGRKKVIPFEAIQRVEKQVIDRFVTNGTASTTIDFTLVILLKNSKQLNLYIKTDSFSTEEEKTALCNKWNPVMDKLVTDVSAAVNV